MTALQLLVARELAVPADPRVTAFAAHIANEYGEAARAVLFYGSCLRSAELDGQMLDFYLIVSDYAQAYGKGWLSFANRVLPPNVFPAAYAGMRGKIAILSETDFARLASSRTLSVSVWARFAQPARLIWAKDAAARACAIDAVAQAAPALLSAALPMAPAALTPLDLWRLAFDLTYSAELRAERSGRSGSVVDYDPERYRAFTLPALAAAGIDARFGDDGLLHNAVRRTGDGPARWRRRRLSGKLLTIARLAKASTTYAGGIDYLAWKINRHAGTKIEVRDWQRRWPILGGLAMLPRLIFRGAVR